MIILGIETSCDETAASVVRDGREVLSHVLATSLEMHIKTGGVIPEQAAREQTKSIMPVIEMALKEGCGWDVDNLNSPPIDAIAVTVGPGLIGSLLVGVETAKSLGFIWGKPIVPVNHLVAHLYGNWLEQEAPKFPAIALVVSGGHTDLVYIKDHGDIEYLGGTRDDAAGEAFDKTARLLGLKGFMGGPAIAAAAESFRKSGKKVSFKLPRPMADSQDFDFSFSGLKTAVARLYSESPGIAQEELAYEIQEAATDVLVQKTMKAVEKYKPPTLLLGGGVAANSRLREKFELRIKNSGLHVNFRVPPIKFCTDNASYIASCAEFNYSPIPWQELVANPSLTMLG